MLFLMQLILIQLYILWFPNCIQTFLIITTNQMLKKEQQNGGHTIWEEIQISLHIISLM